MKGDERRRFCGQCRLHVYNVSVMTRADAAEFVAHAEGRVCVRYYRRVDGTILTRDCPGDSDPIRRGFVRLVAGLLLLVPAVAACAATIERERLRSLVAWLGGETGPRPMRRFPPSAMMGDLVIRHVPFKLP